jgi:hypothetical protein
MQMTSATTKDPAQIQPAAQSWVNVAVFDRLAAGQALHGFLVESGFGARIHDERKLQRFWFLVSPQAGIQVQVPQDSIEAVRQHLDQSGRTKALLHGAIRCPSCRSSNIQYPQMTRKFILPTLFAHLLVLFRIMEPDCYCEDCHNEWVRPRGRPAPRPS